jgi:putative protease
MVIGPKTGVVEFTIERIHIGDGIAANEACKGQICTIPVPCKIRLADKLYLWQEKKDAQR